MPDFFEDAPGLQPKRDSPPRQLHPVPSGATDPYPLRALRDEVQRVAGAVEGARNHTLNRAAFSLGQLVAGGALDPPARR